MTAAKANPAYTEAETEILGDIFSTYVRGGNEGSAPFREVIYDLAEKLGLGDDFRRPNGQHHRGKLWRLIDPQASEAPCSREMIVRAEDEESARKIAVGADAEHMARHGHPDWEGLHWMDQQRTTCQQVPLYGAPGALLVDFYEP